MDAVEPLEELMEESEEAFTEGPAAKTEAYPELVQTSDNSDEKGLSFEKEDADGFAVDFTHVYPDVDFENVFSEAQDVSDLLVQAFENAASELDTADHTEKVSADASELPVEPELPEESKSVEEQELIEEPASEEDGIFDMDLSAIEFEGLSDFEQLPEADQFPEKATSEEAFSFEPEVSSVQTAEEEKPSSVQTSSGEKKRRFGWRRKR